MRPERILPDGLQNEELNIEMTTPLEVSELIGSFLGKPVCRQQVGKGRSLSIGFGRKILHTKPNNPDAYYGEWEVGTYIGAWKIIQDDKIVIGSQDFSGSLQELDKKI